MRTTALVIALAMATQAHAAAPLTAPINSASGARAGSLTLTDAPNGVVLRVEATGLSPGWHAIHFHEKAECGDAGFKASGSHVHGATPAVHGLLNPQANDLGDLPNIFADASGKATAELYSTLVALRGGTPRATLVDTDGSAVIIHAKVDNHVDQPIGGAGERVACALVE